MNQDNPSAPSEQTQADVPDQKSEHVVDTSQPAEVQQTTTETSTTVSPADESGSDDNGGDSMAHSGTDGAVDSGATGAN